MRSTLDSADHLVVSVDNLSHALLFQEWLTEIAPTGKVVFEIEARLAEDSIPVTYRALRFVD